MTYFKGYMSTPQTESGFTAFKLAKQFGAATKFVKGEDVLCSFEAPEGVFKYTPGTVYFPATLDLL